MMKIKLNYAVGNKDSYTYDDATARIVGSKIVVESGSECVMVTEFGNVKELVKDDADGK